MDEILTTKDGCQIAWRSDGPDDAPTLILSNSLGSDLSMWERQVASFLDKFRVIRYDQRGHGGSSVGTREVSLERLGCDVIELLDLIGIERAHFCGVSLGGMIGQWLGSCAPERIDRLILAFTSAYMGPPSAWQDRIELVRSSGMEAIADTVVSRWVTSDFALSNPERVTELRAMVAAIDPAGYASCCAAIRDMDLRPTAASIVRPTLIVAGAMDPATPPEHGRFLLDSIPDSELLELEGAHLSNIECAEKFNQAVQSFLVRQ